jgi:hypothetical protein
MRANSPKIALYCGSELVREVTIGWVDWQRSGVVELALLDRRVLAAIDGRTVLVQAVSSTEATPSLPLSQPLAIGAVSAEVRISELHIYRDLYFLHPWGHSADWEMEGALSSDEIFVLGDNCPLSDDSRNWEQPGVSVRNVLGYVEAPYPSE